MRPELGDNGKQAWIPPGQYPDGFDAFARKPLSRDQFPNAVAFIVIERLEFLQLEHLEHGLRRIFNMLKPVCRSGQKHHSRFIHQGVPYLPPFLLAGQIAKKHVEVFDD